MSQNIKGMRGLSIWQGAKIATMDSSLEQDYGLLDQHDLITLDDKIIGVFKAGSYDIPKDALCFDLTGLLITPGLIDCHTHLVFGGNRAKEWEMRQNGVPYAEIAAQGGGINSTVKQTREESFNALYDRAYPRMLALAEDGVTTLESKTGYGLNLESERKQLQVSKALGVNYPIEIVPTLLSAHAIPPEFKGDGDAYIELVCKEILPTLWQEEGFEAVDVFCESVGFTLEQTQKVFEAAKALKIPVKGHMEQMSNLGGSELIAQYQGLSVDHIEFLDEAAIKALSKSGTVATLLPLAFYFLRETQKPPIELLRKYGVPMAVSTDYNPGTSPFTSLRMAMNAAGVLFGLTPQEVLAGVTIHAAKALNRAQTHGQIRSGFKANFIAWNVEDPVEIFYEVGYNPLVYRIFEGRIH
ncbi:imidazolonepropionase [Ignatzschineria rhizosphaerae]|uniref:Imidazolonepropionase n=1 Tax=Ignatzschineria rhizosphaerae TaxID=2923279 RepID=A0ABY3X983_9GAMM|nr:imidazolonepropionase [Ignatzschineria rhizosphaerae]UNM96528.1 imidazolonepropionase [Ignatzschineria rhizosphaerae]